MSEKRKSAVLFASILAIFIIFILSTQHIFAASSKAVLKTDMSGSAVTALQKDLKRLGYMTIAPTGYYGNITERAVRSFQKKNGLLQDGIAGPITLNKLRKLSASAGSAAVSRGISGNRAVQIVSFAKRLLGIRYVWGGTTQKGFDCSGFMKYVFKSFGITLNRVSAAQAEQGSPVKKSELLPGDLVFFDTNGGHNRINHVGMYIGGGKFIQASSAQDRVVISDITKGFYAKAYMKARRVLP